MCLKQNYKMNEKYFFCANLVVLLWVEEKGGEMRDKERAALVPFVSDHKIRRWVREWLEDLNTERQVQKGFSPINLHEMPFKYFGLFWLGKNT